MRFASALAWHAEELANGLTEAGHDVMLFCQAGSPLARRLRGAPFAVHDKLRLNSWSPLQAISEVSEMRRALANFRPDILNPHCPPGHTFFALANFASAIRVPLVRTVAEPRKPKANPVNRLLHLRRTEGIIFTSASSVERYRHVFKLAHISTKVILPGFRADDFTRDVASGDYRKQLGVPEGALFCGIIARMAPEKGQEVLIEAVSLLQQDVRSQIFVVMAGEDSRERGSAQLEALAREFKVESNLAFLPKLDDVRPLMSELDLGIVTSTRSEAICRVALEYMSFGIPVVSSDVNILPEVVHDGKSGWVFRNYDAPRLAEILSECMVKRNELAERGRAGKRLVHGALSRSSQVASTLQFYADARERRALT